MQVARNYFLSRDQTFVRKFNEILLALQIERELDKQQILELYLNKIFLGYRAYGVEAAAQVYYGRPIEQLSLDEAALIAGLPKAPSALNPLDNPPAPARGATGSSGACWSSATSIAPPTMPRSPRRSAHASTARASICMRSTPRKWRAPR
jgi:hypothetical protein